MKSAYDTDGVNHTLYFPSSSFTIMHLENRFDITAYFLCLSRRLIVPDQSNQKKYWKKNLQYLAILLSIWFVVSYGFSIILVDYLDKIKIGGFKLGFWFSQQGSLFVFVILIFVYVRLMNKLDKEYNVEEE